jgi:hypothetical protein
MISPKLILQHQLGKIATKIANDVAEVQGRTNFNEVKKGILKSFNNTFWNCFCRIKNRRQRGEEQ